jgi:hypothetical protein
MRLRRAITRGTHLTECVRRSSSYDCADHSRLHSDGMRVVGPLLLFSFTFTQRVLHPALLQSLHRHGPFEGEESHKSQSHLVHHSPGGGVDGHRFGDYALHAELSKTLSN